MPKIVRLKEGGQQARKANYNGATPEQVGRAVLKYDPAKGEAASLSRTKKASSTRPVNQP